MNSDDMKAFMRENRRRAQEMQEYVIRYADARGAVGNAASASGRRVMR